MLEKKLKKCNSINIIYIYIYIYIYNTNTNKILYMAIEVVHEIF